MPELPFLALKPSILMLIIAMDPLVFLRDLLLLLLIGLFVLLLAPHFLVLNLELTSYIALRTEKLSMVTGCKVSCGNSIIAG